MNGIFISYRREDSGSYAGRLYDVLTAHFSRDSVFFDIDSISPGEDFREVIQRTCSACKVMLVVIGRDWSKATDSHGRIRLQIESDYVRLETVTALEKGLRVIPILVGGASMPEESSLPEVLRPLLYRNAWEISDQRFRRDVELLVESLKKSLDTASANPPPNSAKPALFPIYGFIIGKTTASELAQLCHKTWSPDLFDLNGANLSLDKRSGKLNSIYISSGDEVPEPWQKMGFHWQNSQDEWITWLREMGYTAKIESTNAVSRFLDNSKVSTRIKGLMSWPNPHLVKLCFERNASSIERLSGIYFQPE